MSRFPRSPAALAELTRRHANPMWGVYSGATIGGGALVARQRRDSESGVGAASGALAGQLAYQGTGHAVNNVAIRQRMTENKRQGKARRAHFRTHGLDPMGGRELAGNADPLKWRAMWRSYPHNLPGARLTRGLTHTHGGRTGWALGAASTIGGAMLGATAIGHKREHQGGVAKFAPVAADRRPRHANVGKRQEDPKSGRKLAAAGGATALVGSGIGGGLPTIHMFGQPMSIYSAYRSGPRNGMDYTVTGPRSVNSIPARSRLRAGAKAVHFGLASPWKGPKAIEDALIGHRSIPLRAAYGLHAAGVAGVAGGAALGVRNHRRKIRHANVGKRLEVTAETRTSPVRAVETTAGLGALAYGLPRTATVREATRRGRPGAPIDTHVERALRQAEGVRSAMEHSTSPLGRVTGRGVSQLPEPLRSTLLRVPRHLRPATSALVGAILVQHSHPVRRTSYRAVQAPRITGW